MTLLLRTRRSGAVIADGSRLETGYCRLDERREQVREIVFFLFLAIHTCCHLPSSLTSINGPPIHGEHDQSVTSLVVTL